MSKAKMLGMPTKYVPNNRADERTPGKHRNFHQKHLTTEEKPKHKPAEPKHPPCMFNEGVYCTSYSKNYSLLRSAPNCGTCGWNPAVQKARNQKLGIKP